MICYCFLRNTIDLLVGNATAYFKRFGIDYDGPNYPFGCEITYQPRSNDDKARCHALAEKVLHGIFIGFHQVAGGGFQGDLKYVDCEELAEARHPNCVTIKRSKADEIEPVLDSKGDFCFPLAEGDLDQPGQSAAVARKLSEKRD